MALMPMEGPARKINQNLSHEHHCPQASYPPLSLTVARRASNAALLHVDLTRRSKACSECTPLQVGEEDFAPRVYFYSLQCPHDDLTGSELSLTTRKPTERPRLQRCLFVHRLHPPLEVVQQVHHVAVRQPRRLQRLRAAGEVLELLRLPAGELRNEASALVEGLFEQRRLPQRNAQRLAADSATQAHGRC